MPFVTLWYKANERLTSIGASVGSSYTHSQLFRDAVKELEEAGKIQRRPGTEIYYILSEEDKRA